MHSLAEQLLTAMKSRGWSIQRLLNESGLDCDRSSLSRKLHGKQWLSSDEVQVLVNTLEVTVAASPFVRRKRKAA
jgi:transcriptional regulator with XRE-family HTH domain